eukprot:3592845-Pyramimonas_sp.AAC.1
MLFEGPHYCSQLLKEVPGSTSPGVHPGRWFRGAKGPSGERSRAAGKYEDETLGFFAVEDKRPRPALLRVIDDEVARAARDARGRVAAAGDFLP